MARIKKWWRQAGEQFLLVSFVFAASLSVLFGTGAAVGQLLIWEIKGRDDDEYK